MKAYLYTARGHDHEVELSAKLVKGLRRGQLLWIDCSSDVRDIRLLAEASGIEPRVLTAHFKEDRDFRLDNFGDFFTLSVSAIDRSQKGQDERWYGEMPLCFVVSSRWLATIHLEPIEFLRSFQGQDKGETAIGSLTPASLTAALLDWHLAEYFREVECIEAEADQTDQRILSDGAKREILKDIVSIQTRVSFLRATIARERPIFHGLTRADFTATIDDQAAEQFRILSGRFDRAVDEVERSRDVMVGSFNLFSSMTTLDTNDLVKLLSFFTVVIGACAAVAGLLGMNFTVGFFQSGAFGFGIAIAAMVISSGIATWYAKRKGWIY